MVNLTTFMVAATAMLLGVQALDEFTAKKIRDELRKANIIPEAIDDFEPITRLQIRYDEHFDLKNGELLTPEQTLVVPSVWFDAPSIDAEYTLAMVNLDTNGPLVRHWIATNVKGGDKQGTAFLSQAPIHEYTSYRGPTPPSGTHPHRIAFVLFQQEDTSQTFSPEIESTSLRNRDFFDLKQFAQDNHLVPISGAYFYTEHQAGFSQNYPPVSDEQLGELRGIVGDLDEILDDVGQIVGDIDEGIENLIDDDVDDAIDYDVEIEPPIASLIPTGKPRRLRPRPTSKTPEASKTALPKPTHHGLVGDILDMVGEVLEDVGLGLGIDDDKDDNGRKKKGVGIGSSGREVKEAGLIGDVLDDLDDFLGINIGREHNGGRRGRDDDDDDIIIELVDGYPVQKAAVSEASYAQAEASIQYESSGRKVKEAGLIGDVLDDLDDILGISIGRGRDGGRRDRDDDDDIIIELVNGHPVQKAIASEVPYAQEEASVQYESSGRKVKEAGLIGDVLDDLDDFLGINIGREHNGGRRGRDDDDDDIIIELVDEHPVHRAIVSETQEESSVQYEQVAMKNLNEVLNSVSMEVAKSISADPAMASYLGQGSAVKEDNIIGNLVDTITDKVNISINIGGKNH